MIDWLAGTNDLKEKIEKLEKENKKNKEKILNLETTIKNKTNENSNLERENKELREKIEELKKEIEKLIKQKENFEKENIEMKKEEKNIKEKINLMDNTREKMNLKKDPLEFYDIIVGINSLKNVKIKGWEVIMSEKGKQFVNSEEKEKILVVGVLGNRNKGKSFILQSLSGEDLQTGTSINTIGLSLKLTKEKYILLDSAGSESPLLGNDGDIKEISRDKLFTENFIQTYIMNYSNVLLLVVGNMTFSEQKLINRISLDLERLKKKRNRSLLIIHNLQTLETIEQVENYVKEYLLNSATFHLEKDHSVFDGLNCEYYYDSKNKEIRHLIYAKEFSEAGNFYNPKAIKLIKSTNAINTDKYNYNYFNTLNEHFKIVGKEMFDLNKDINFELNENELTKDSEENNEFNEKLIKYNSCLKFETENDIELKKFVIDELGGSSFVRNGFNPDYEFYYNDKELILKIDCPGDEVTLEAKRKKNKDRNIDIDYYIEITGERKDVKTEGDKITYIKKRDTGKLYLLTAFSNNQYSVGKLKSNEKQNGIQTFVFPLEESED